MLRKHVKYEDAKDRVTDLDMRISAEGPEDQTNAQETTRKNRLEGQLTVIDTLQSEMDDAVELLELGIAAVMENVADAGGIFVVVSIAQALTASYP